ncbi:hypothetical protein [Peribacillus alkalitolerans]|uniref:hypothetical protein n=1 Tax=Peribacillus alkalitolerans TaxID=1550385 RepID=UPI0013D77C94|nr:hypothetical protein [Peribacillus alkalitolerans]
MKKKVLKKVVYAMSPSGLQKNIFAHEERGWKKASPIKEYGYGLGCLMIFEGRNGGINPCN